MMTSLPPATVASAPWSARAVDYLSALLATTQALASAEFRNDLLVQEKNALKAQLTEANAALAGRIAPPCLSTAPGMVLEAQAIAIRRLLGDQGLAFNDQKSVVDNVADALAWLRLALEQERQAAVSLRADLAEAQEAIDTDAVEAGIEQAGQRLIYQTVLKHGLPWGEERPFAENVVITIEGLVGTAKAGGPTVHDLEQLEHERGEAVAELERQSDIISRWEGLAEGYLARAQAAEAENAELRDKVARLVAELNEAERKGRETANHVGDAPPGFQPEEKPMPASVTATVPKAYACTERECRGCGKTFVPSFPTRKYCADCRPDPRTDPDSPYDYRVKKADAPKPAAQPKPAPAARPRSQGEVVIPCASCKHGEVCGAADFGYQCKAEMWQECRPLDKANRFVPREVPSYD
jgi:hypothetical protein